MMQNTRCELGTLCVLCETREADVFASDGRLYCWQCLRRRRSSGAQIRMLRVLEGRPSS